MFKCTQGKGFEISFPNGLTASVQWGPFDPCSNDIDLKAAEELQQLGFIRDCSCENAAISCYLTASGRNVPPFQFMPDAFKGLFTGSCADAPICTSDTIGFLPSLGVVHFLCAVGNAKFEDIIT